MPGVGSVAAVSFKVGVDDLQHFVPMSDVGSHFGLTPTRHHSGTSTDYEGPHQQAGRRCGSGGRCVKRPQCSCCRSGNGPHRGGDQLRTTH
ncbi:transposase [Bradyrhizobium valentinum]|uniref:transposase n=1 Tax=Bradyrhizobium valentinum TaxID=1518501 RepID=UPI0018D22A9F